MDNKYITIPLNFKPGEPTVNGHIYDKDSFNDMIKEYLSRDKPLVVTIDQKPSTILINTDIIGYVKGYDEVNYTFDIEPLLKGEVILKLSPFLTTSGYGKHEEINGIKYIKDFKLSHLYITEDGVKGIIE